MKSIHCNTCQNRGCAFKQMSETSPGFCYGYEPKLKLSGVELFILNHILSLVKLNDKFKIVEINEKEDGILTTGSDAPLSLTDGIELLSESIPDREVLSEEYWINIPEIEVWEDIKARFCIKKLYEEDEE